MSVFTQPVLVRRIPIAGYTLYLNRLQYDSEYFNVQCINNRCICLYTDTTIGYPTLEADILANPENTAAVFEKIFGAGDTPTSSSDLEREHVTAIVVATLAVIMLAVLIIVLVSVISYKHRNRKGK